MSRIAIDMGHGGKDPGASGKGMLEKKINYNVGKKLGELLQQEGFDVVFTRKEDEYLELSQRAKLANAAGADVMISIHHNAGGGDGFEIIYQCDPKVTRLSNRLAVCIENEFSKLNNERKVYSKKSTTTAYEDYHTVLALASMPAVITEFAFLDTADVDAVDTLTDQWNEAQAIKNGLKKYFGRV